MKAKMIAHTQKKTIKPKPNPYIVVKRSTIHSNGVFAKKRIPKGTRIIEYVGEKVSKKESDRRADIPLKEAAKDSSKGAVYIFTLNRWHDIDGNVPYNTAKYINHSCEPNCEVDIIRNRIWVTSIKDIKKGEELSYNYGYDIDDYEEHKCVCRTEQCVGYILAEDHWPKLKKQQKSVRKKKRS